MYQSRVTQSVEQALDIAEGTVRYFWMPIASKRHVFSQRYACVDHPNAEIPELEPRIFSFNSPQGACPVCTGLGHRLEVDPELVFNPNLTVAEGAIRPYNRVNSDMWYVKRLEAVADAHGFDLRTPIKEMSDDDKQKILYGTGDQKYRVQLGTRTAL